MKKVLIISFFFIILSLAGLKYLYPRNKDGILHRIKIELFDENPIKVICENGINSNDLIIKWDSDFTAEKTIWSYNKQKSRIENDYGPQGFSLYLDNFKFCRVGHMKTNNWHTHKYTFRIYKDLSGDTLVDFIVNGPNALKVIEINQ